MAKKKDSSLKTPKTKKVHKDATTQHLMRCPVCGLTSYLSVTKASLSLTTPNKVIINNECAECGSTWTRQGVIDTKGFPITSKVDNRPPLLEDTTKLKETIQIIKN